MSESAADETGFAHVETTPDTLATEVSAFPYVADFEATWWLSRYRKRVGEGGLAHFEVLSSPTKEARGTQLNPVPSFEYAALVRTFSASTGEGAIGRAFSSVLAVVERDGDVVVPVGVHPREADESDAVHRLVAGIERPAEEADADGRSP